MRYTYVRLLSHFVGSLRAHIALHSGHIFLALPLSGLCPIAPICWLEGSRYTSVRLHLFLVSIARINGSETVPIKGLIVS